MNWNVTFCQGLRVTGLSFQWQIDTVQNVSHSVRRRADGTCDADMHSSEGVDLHHSG